MSQASGPRYDIAGTFRLTARLRERFKKGQASEHPPAVPSTVDRPDTAPRQCRFAKGDGWCLRVPAESGKAIKINPHRHPDGTPTTCHPVLSCEPCELPAVRTAVGLKSLLSENRGRTGNAFCHGESGAAVIAETQSTRWEDCI